MKKKIILLSVLAMLTMTGCGKKESVTESTPASNTTESSKTETKHVYSSTYTYDEENHWKKCTTAGHTDTTTKEKHVYDSNLDENCNVCGYTRTIKHTYSSEWQSDEKSHWHVCTEEGHSDVGDKADHTFGEWTVSVPATYTSDEVLERACTVCGKKEEKTNPDSKLPKKSRELSVADIADITYDGLAHPITDDMITRTNDIGGITIEYKKDYETEYKTDAPIDSGTYDYRVTLKGTDEWEEKVVTGIFYITQYALALTKASFDSLGVDDDGEVILYTYDVSTISNGRDSKVNLHVSSSYNTPGRHTIDADELTLDNANYTITYIEGRSTYEVVIYDTAIRFLAAIQSVTTVTGKGVLITTLPIMQGNIEKGRSLYVNELGKWISVNSIQLTSNKADVEKATIGDSIAILITGATEEELSYGMMLTSIGALDTHQCVFADLTGIDTAITSGSYYTAYFPDSQTYHSVRVTLSNDVSTLNPGETNTDARIDFGDTTTAWVGREFEIQSVKNICATAKVKSIHDHESTLAKTGKCTECGLNNVKAITFNKNNKATSGSLQYFKGEAYVFTISILPGSEETKYKFALSVSTSESTSDYAMNVTQTIGTTVTDITSQLSNGVLTMPASTIATKKGILISTTIVRGKAGFDFTTATFNLTKQSEVAEL